MSTVLNVFKILGGFPFDVDTKDGKLKSNPRVWLYCFARNTITVLLIAMVLIILEVDTRKFVVMFDNFLDLGMTVTHLVCALLLFIPNLIGLFGALWNYIGFAEKYNSLSGKMCTLYSRSLRTGEPQLHFRNFHICIFHDLFTNIRTLDSDDKPECPTHSFEIWIGLSVRLNRLVLHLSSIST